MRNSQRSLQKHLEEVRDRIDRVDSDVKSLVDEPNWEQIHEEAVKLDQRAQKEDLPLYGTTAVIKDIIHVDGLPTKANCNIPPERLTESEASSVTKLREAGTLILAKAVTTEMAFNEPGPTRNPYNLDHTPGGSSSGSAAAVGAGLCSVSLGTQTTGSTLRPAAFCGAVGFKSTFGRIPTDGIIERASSLDHIGVITQDVEGMELVASILCNDWSANITISKKPVLGVPTGSYIEKLRHEGASVFDKQTEMLDKAGYQLKEINILDNIDSLYRQHRAQNAIETALSHHELFEEFEECYSEVTSSFIQDGREEKIETLGRLRAGQKQFQEEIESKMSNMGIDMLVCPPALGTAPEGINDTGSSIMNMPWTRSGMPALSIPSGTVNGLPVGLQCICQCDNDEQLLIWAQSIESIISDSINMHLK